MNKKRDMYVLLPDFKDTYEGIKVTKDLKLSFENKYVKQRINNMKLTTTMKIVGDRYVTTTKTVLELFKDDILLIEEEGRGYFLPDAGQAIGTVDQAIGEYELLKAQINKMNGEN